MSALMEYKVGFSVVSKVHSYCWGHESMDL